MKPAWTGPFVGKMHVYEVTQQNLADEMGVGKPYVNFILNGRAAPKGAKERMEQAFEAILRKRKEAGKDAESQATD